MAELKIMCNNVVGILYAKDNLNNYHTILRLFVFHEKEEVGINNILLYTHSIRN